MASLVYPLTIEAGDIVITNNEDDINRNAIESCVRTKVDERVRRPEYGRELEPFNTITDLGSIARSVRRSIEVGASDYELGNLGVLAYLREGATTVQVTYEATTLDIEL